MAGQIFSDVVTLLFPFFVFLRAYKNIRYFRSLHRESPQLVGWFEISFRSVFMLPFPIFAQNESQEVRRLARMSNYTLTMLYFVLVLSWAIAMNIQDPTGTAQ